MSISLNQKTQVVLLEFNLPPHGSHTVSHLTKLLGLKSSYTRSRSKDAWCGWVLRRISIVLHSSCLRWGHCTFLNQCRINPLRLMEKDWSISLWGCVCVWVLLLGVREPLSPAKKMYQNLRLNVPTFTRVFFLHVSTSIYRSCFFPVNAPHFNRGSLVSLGIQLAV